MGAIPPYVPQVAERDSAIESLNSLLRGEISAAETYTMAIDKFADSDKTRVADVQTLREIQEEHGRACQKLRERVRELGGEPSNSSGAWGAWAKTVEGAASLFGDKAALKALKEGEEHGLKQYNDICDEVDTASAQLIASELIPAQHRHINLLDKMLGNGSRA
jgi:bacterioferritin (cytochrome b1)